jgi:hypothetical protein
MAGTSGLELGDPFLRVTHDKPGTIEDIGHYFGFDTARADAVIGHAAWDAQTFEAGGHHYNATRSGVVVLFRNHPNCTDAGSCGRWDPPSSAAAGDWAINDYVGLLPSKTPFSVRCSAPEDFQVTAGSLMVLGPTSANGTCTAGEACAVHDIEGLGLSDGDRLAVLDTCGVAEDHIPAFAGGDASVSATASGMIIAWSGAATPAGGVYRLCWCAVGFRCSQSEDFVVDAGALLVKGPAKEQARTCVAGQTCVVDQILGTGLSQSDKIVLLDTCATVSAVPRTKPTVRGLTAGAFAVAARSGTAFTFGKV